MLAESTTSSCIRLMRYDICVPDDSLSGLGQFSLPG